MVGDPPSAYDQAFTLMPKKQYVLSKLIARGGMAEIYLGKGIGEDSFQRVCAIKRILPHHAQDTEFVKMFRDEAHICKRLQHANIVQVYDFTEVENSYALIMEYVKGCDLRSLLASLEKNQVRLAIPMIIYITASVARGLQYAHTKVDEVTNEPIGIIHRDISPQNVLLSYDGDVKIIDFGIASSETKIAETHPGVVKGKYAYMSPEQVMAKNLDPRSDVFSLAVVMWECLTMRRLFTGKSEVETIRKVGACQIPNDLEKPDLAIPLELQRIVKKGLEKHRDNRYQSALEFEKDLLRFLHLRYPEFMPRDLGHFIQKLLANKRSADEVNIKKVLTQTGVVSPQHAGGLKSLRDKMGGSQHPGQSKPGGDKINLVFDEKKHTTKIRLADLTLTRSETHQPRSLPRHNRYKRRRSTLSSVGSAISQNLIGSLIILLSLTFVGRYVYSQLVSQLGKSLKVEINANVGSAKIILNGKLIQKGKYVTLPARLNLKPGTHKISLKRSGYEVKTITVKGAKGEVLKPEWVLSSKTAQDVAHVKVISGDDKLFVDVNGGLFKGHTPLNLVLRAGKPHMLKATLLQNPSAAASLRCKFTINPSNDLEHKQMVIRLRISSATRRCLSSWQEL